MVVSNLAVRGSQHLMELGSNTLCGLIKRNGPIAIPNRYGDDPLMGLCQIVISQQLSNQAARSIWLKICKSLPDRTERLTILKSGQSASFGLSNAKRRTLKIVLDHGDKWLKLISKQSFHSRYNALTNLWGIGPWSAAMWELFVLKNPDIWADGDLILKRMSKILADEAGVMRPEWIESAAPYRSFLALYCWKLNNSR